MRMAAPHFLIVFVLVLLARGQQYTPQGVPGGSCSDLPVELHTAVKQRIEELEGKLEFSDQLSEITASVKVLNTSLQQQDSELAATVSELAAEVRNIQTIVGNLDSGGTTDGTMTTSASTTPSSSTPPPPTTEPTPATTDPTSPGTFLNPVSSCKDIPPGSPSGEYWIQNNKTGSPVQAYCDMTRMCCGISGGWMRIANLDMTDPAQNCPDGFNQVNRTMPPLRTCGRPGGPGCVPTMFSVIEPTYSHVCGKIIGYQYGGASAFVRGTTLFATYITGVSLTYGNKQHIWSFVAARDQVTNDTDDICPCTRPDLSHNTATAPYSLVGQDYFCDTGSASAFMSMTFYDMNPLWDGQGCEGTSDCCEFNSPPWFCKQLSQQIADDIELRLCHTAGNTFADVLLETVELYIR